MKKHPLLSAFLCAMATASMIYAAPAMASQTTCPDAEGAAAAAAAQTATDNKTLRPEVNNPTVEAVRGSQCMDQSSNFETILQDLQSLPIGSQGQQILQVIEQLFGNTQNACNPSGQSETPSIPQGGTLPTTTIVQPSPVTPTQDSDGPGSSSASYQSLFPSTSNTGTTNTNNGGINLNNIFP
jgi:hypothetical protein